MIQNNKFITGVIQLRGGTKTALSTVNPLLSRREIMVETDTGRIKVGDGEKSWNELPYSCGIDMPPNDGNTYAMRNGEWVIINS